MDCMPRVAVFLLPPVVGFDAAIAPMLSPAPRRRGQRALRGRHVWTDARARRGDDRLRTCPAPGPRCLHRHTVVIPGTRYPPARLDGVLAAGGVGRAGADPSRHPAVSICTGAFVLAAAGLLDGRPATTHWKFADALRRMHPEVLVDENVLFVDDGDVLTSAGLAAGIDLCLHIIRRDHGAQVANAVARYCVVPPWREGGQAQFIDRQMPTPDHYSTAGRGSGRCGIWTRS